MQRTIQIGDKYKPLMDYYSGLFDKEEFNVFFTQLLIAYKKMKDKNIDLITFSELVEPYDIDIIDLIKLVTENAERKEQEMVSNNEMTFSDTAKTVKGDLSKVTVLKPAEKQTKEPAPADNPILKLGIDLSN